MKHDETHGWAWDAIGFGNIEFLAKNIQESIQVGGLVENMTVINDGYKIFYIVNPIHNPVQICLIIKSDDNGNFVESFYPLIEGIENEITITGNYGWENNLEGEIMAVFMTLLKFPFFPHSFVKNLIILKIKSKKYIWLELLMI